MGLGNGMRAIRAIGRLFSKASQEDINYNFARCLPYDRITVSRPLAIKSSAVGHVHLELDFAGSTSGIDIDDASDGGTPVGCVHIKDLTGTLTCDGLGGGQVIINDAVIPVAACPAADENG